VEVAVPSGYRIPRPVKREFFDLVCSGVAVVDATHEVGLGCRSGWNLWRQAGGMKLRRGRCGGGLAPPLTVESGRKRTVRTRHVRNHRLYDAIDQWAFAALTGSPGARALYDQHRAAGDTHHQALRAVGNRLVGILHGCLRHHTPYNEHTAWAHRTPAAA
jgi:hypothetical protein